MKNENDDDSGDGICGNGDGDGCGGCIGCGGDGDDSENDEDNDAVVLHVPLTKILKEHWPVFFDLSVQLHCTVVFPRPNLVPDWWVQVSWTSDGELSEHDAEFHVTTAAVLPFTSAFTICLGGQFTVGLVTSVIDEKHLISLSDYEISW